MRLFVSFLFLFVSTGALAQNPVRAAWEVAAKDETTTETLQSLDFVKQWVLPNPGQFLADVLDYLQADATLTPQQRLDRFDAMFYIFRTYPQRGLQRVWERIPQAKRLMINAEKARMAALKAAAQAQITNLDGQLAQ